MQPDNQPTGTPLGNSVPTPPPEIEASSRFSATDPVDPDNPSWGLGMGVVVCFASIALTVVVQLIFLLPYAVAIGFKSFDPLSKTSILLQVISVFPAHLLTFALVWMVVTRFGKQSFEKAIGWGWEWAYGFRLVACIALGVFLFVVGIVIAKVFGADKPTLLEQTINSSLAARYLISFLAVFTAPFVEEFIYRGVLYAPLQRLAGARWAVIIVLLLFTVIHVPQYWPNVGVISAVALLSIVLTLIRAYSGRLLPCIIIHLVFNSIQAFLLVAGPYLQRFFAPPESVIPPLLLPLLGGLI